ncbi:TIGR00730 family Rossman fold protein [Cryomorpha ignava]|uniref:Cytokinin riboside 5'-monophosphate phosphoribohydrolase n=1 Tax=Cryomorpha ignava TaxID=101383 RepID=A0A7K3WUE5_9FLAO|nr:TIGR00730 family Rossman fold protein [Cryomorpha ignava]NEN25124.1 TIGR00730 family Rossman fold protein [Cryomorpha ignava]
MKRISVFCASSIGHNPIYKETAYQLGAFLAKREIGVVYGGSHLGLMGAVAQGALDNNGEVIGVLPHFMSGKEIAHPGLSKLFMVDSMHDRKLKMYELSDGIIALPGGFGTFEELFEMLTWAQLGLHKEPIGILNINGYYDHLLAMIETMRREGLLKESNAAMVLHSSNAIDLYDQMMAYVPDKNVLTIQKDQT